MLISDWMSDVCSSDLPGLHDAVERRMRRSRRHRRWLGRAKQVVDLVMEDQRQSGHAEHEQEGRADEARPFVDALPCPDRGGCEHGRLRLERRLKADAEGAWVQQVRGVVGPRVPRVDLYRLVVVEHVLDEGAETG